jgi:hypothetical protein
VKGCCQLLSFLTETRFDYDFDIFATIINYIFMFYIKVAITFMFMIDGYTKEKISINLRRSHTAQKLRSEICLFFFRFSCEGGHTWNWTIFGALKPSF